VRTVLCHRYLIQGLQLIAQGLKKGIIMRKVISILIVLLGIVATGCEYEAPLAGKQGLPIDNSVLGIWQSITPDGKPQSKDWISISRYSETEYLVRNHVEKESVDYRGYPIRVAGVSCIQIQAKPKKGIGRYYVFSYELLNGDLLIKGLNPNLVSNELKSSSELRTAFLRHKNNKDLFIDAGRFRKMSKEQIDARISAVYKEISAVDKEIAELDLLIASIKGDIATVRDLLARGVNPNANNKDGYTALMVAAQEGHLPVVQALLAKRANPNIKNNAGATALMVAAQNGHAAVVRALLAKGADVNAKTEKGHTALDYASNKGHTAIVEVLRRAQNKP
jgi:hypothetical protein